MYAGGWEVAWVYAATASAGEDDDGGVGGSADGELESEVVLAGESGIQNGKLWPGWLMKVFL